MTFKGSLVLLATLLTFLDFNQAFTKEQELEESDQQINDFSLAGYGEQGKKAWDLSGKCADIFGELIKLKTVIGNLYGKEEEVKLTADKGDFDKSSGKVHLEDNVIITTSSGAQLTTDSLNWDRKNQLISTNDIVNIKKEDMFTVARGAIGRTNLNNVTLQKEVKVEINPKTQNKTKTDPDLGQQDTAGEKIIITCDGELQIDYAKNIATFNKNVKVDRGDAEIYSDFMDVYFLSNKDSKSNNSPSLMGSKIDKIVCRGNVKIVRGENISYSDEAVYTAQDKKILLSGKPKLIIYSTESPAKSAQLENANKTLELMESTKGLPDAPIRN